MTVHNLVIKYEKNRAEIEKWIRENNLSKENEKFKVGQIIEFWAGYNGDIRYKTEITGFGKNGEIYLLWDAYWSHIKDDDYRKIKVVENYSIN